MEVIVVSGFPDKSVGGGIIKGRSFVVSHLEIPNLNSKPKRKLHRFFGYLLLLLLLLL
jgi:hypothetical protein